MLDTKTDLREQDFYLLHLKNMHGTMSRLILHLLLTVCLTSEAEVDLLKHLFDGYNSDARPVLKDSDAVNVTLGITISQIVDVVSIDHAVFYLGCMHRDAAKLYIRCIQQRLL